MQIRCEQLDELEMVRVSHDGSGHTPAWFLEEIRARNKAQPLPSCSCYNVLRLFACRSVEKPFFDVWDACLGLATV